MSDEVTQADRNAAAIHYTKGRGGPIAKEIREGKRDDDRIVQMLVAYRLVSTKALVEALEFYADADGDGYQAYPAEYGLSMDLGDIIKDGGERARQALAAHSKAQS